jgi:hypothetical protein
MRTRTTLYLACALALAAHGCATSPLTQLEKATERIRAKTQYVDVEPANLIFDSGPQPLIQYVLTLTGRSEESRQAAYLFDSKQYTLHDFSGTPKETPTSEICTLVDSLSDRAGTLGDALGELNATGTVRISPGGPSIEIKLEGPARTVIDVSYALSEMLTVRSLRAEVLVRGFADGEVTAWERELDPQYRYTSIEVMPPVDEAAPIAFKRTRETIRVPNAPMYSNGDLPNLRARYVKDVLIDSYLANCPGDTPASSAILKGFAYKEALRPLNRMVQIYIVFYDRR